MAKTSNGFKVITSVIAAVVVVFGLTYFLHAQQQNQVEKNGEAISELQQTTAVIKEFYKLYKPEIWAAAEVKINGDTIEIDTLP